MNKQTKIILFLCNWGPHAAYLSLQDEKQNIPEAVHMVRIPCTGRVDRALLLRAFAKGADGVAMIGCSPGTCRYGSGTPTAIRNTQDTGTILDLMGIGQERLRFATFLPEQSEELLEFLQTFLHDIQKLGPTAITTLPDNPLPANPLNLPREEVSALVNTYDIHACQDCGKCSSACPLALVGKPFSARGIATAVINNELYKTNVQENVWSCLTCGLCYERCPSAVNFPAFIKELRYLYQKNTIQGNEAHGGFLHSLMRSMASPDLTPNRYQNIPEKLKIDPDSNILFYGGCAPYFDIFFSKHIDVNTEKILFDSIRLLNFFDVHPRLLGDERCCGHDLLWSGEQRHFKEVARLNVERLNSLGIETMITTCPECYMTFKTTYPDMGFQLNFEVVHLYDFLEKEIDRGAVEFTSFDKAVTFQDSCRLCRLEDRQELPRQLLARLQPNTFTEMRESGKGSMCCGNTAWTGCDSYSKAMQVKRLQQAKETGAELLITSCPKCQIHLQCAMQDPFREEELQIEMLDLTSVIAQTITWK
ncbi:hydrogenase iron-sulfur subunit [Desulfogranum japonicum]|uniref:hydrogenase iron-sulfur subunit n=1 Tax=Desulfogranum japonicum TaxID=231447 RepID=UPI0003FF9BAC|nr:hydrogenase iron-sulfur subunit [Desulfogranum japonicum]